MGPFLIAVAALLWATDALFRFPTVNSLSPLFIVFAEHLICVVVLLPWVVLFRRKVLFKLGPGQWISSALIGVGGSALATILFTTSFRFINPSVAVLLQKLQPILVVVLAFTFLGERPGKSFYPFAAIALVAGIVLSFPDFKFDFMLSGEMSLHSRGVIYALTAAALWAVSTVASKQLLTYIQPTIAAFWRFVFGLVTLSALLAMTENTANWTAASQWPMMRVLLYLGLCPGLAAMLAYYAGMRKTLASTTTFIELLFPVGSVVLNTLFLDTPLNTVQIISGAVLLFAVTKISYQAPLR